ncbi:MAG: four helix bundle protein [Anaerolineaceae bacterium]|nr:MAG: four helix bundle protein [Anaerolineaceae bacterium]
MSDAFIKFEEWEKTVPAYMKKNPLWEALYYRVALYLYDLVWDDCDLLQKDFRARSNVTQIVHGSGSVSANMEEAYGRGVGTPDYVRIIKISLGEARETRGWYYRSRHALPADLLEHRYKVCDHLIGLITSLLNSHKRNLGKK